MSAMNYASSELLFIGSAMDEHLSPCAVQCEQGDDSLTRWYSSLEA